MHPSRGLFDGVYTGSRRRFASLGVFVGIAAALAAIATLFFGGEYAQRYLAYREARGDNPPSVSVFEPVLSIARNTIAEIPTPWLDERLVNSGLAVYDLRIASKDLRELQRVSERVTANFVSTGIIRDYVPAKFWRDGGWTSIDVKLRGLTSRHYRKKHPSLRLKFPKNRLFEGKKQINLIHPYDKLLTVDVTTNWELERYGILTWDSKFVVLRTNGDVTGLFQEIEQFGRSMADRGGRPEGFIFSGSGQFFGSEGPGYHKARAAMELFKGCMQSPEIEPRQHCDTRFFLDYFDADRWAWAGAMTVLLHSGSAWNPDDLRLFWDPAHGKFEPIPWDYAFSAIRSAANTEGGPLSKGYARTLFGIPEYRRMLDQRLWILLGERVDAMIEHSEGLFDDLGEALRSDMQHPFFARDVAAQQLYIDTLRENRRFLMERFRSHDLRADFWPGDAGRLTVSLENHGKSFLTVSELVVRQAGVTRTLSLQQPVIVDGIFLGEPGRAQFTVSIPADANPVGMVARDEVTGSSVAEASIRFQPGAGEPPAPHRVAEAQRLALNVANVRVETARVTLGPGRVQLDETLEIPASHEVVFAPGLELAMGPGVSLLVYGDLTGIGTAERPIRVFGTDPGRPWGALVVQGTRTDPVQVRLEHTRIQGGAGGENARTHFTAAFAVHDGVVSLRYNEFLDAAAADGINLKYSTVDLEGNAFRGSEDDAVDCDFCRGRLHGNEITDVGGDGLDFSGSDVVVEDNTIARCGDKGMSIGEKTKAIVRRNIVEDCYTGIAVKDLSNAEISSTRLSRLQVGVALYVKKPTFGPSRATLKDVQMDDVATRFILDGSSTLEQIPASIRGRLDTPTVLPR